MNFLQQVAIKSALATLRFSGWGGQQSIFGRNPGITNWLTGLLPGSTRNWEREAGNVWENSAVSILLRWFSNTFCEAPFVVKQLTAEGTYETVPLHPLSKLVKRPNPFFTRTQLFKAILLSLFVDGNAYIFKERSGAGKVAALWWIPHWMVEPRWDQDGDKFITHYDYMVDGVIYRLEVNDVVHFKEQVDPTNHRKGYAPLKALLKEICTDNQILTYTYGIVKNCGVPAAILKPPPAARVEVTDAMGKATTAAWKKNNSGDNAGGIMVMNTPWDITTLGLSPKDMAIGELGEMSEARLAGCFGIPPVAASLLVGLKTATAKASHKESLMQAYQSGVMPVQRSICETLDLQLLPDLGDENAEYTCFDLSEIQALQEDTTAVHKRADDGWNAGNLTLNESRTMKGLQRDDGPSGDLYKWETDAWSTPGLGGVSRETSGEDNGKKPGGDDPENEDDQDEADGDTLSRSRKELRRKITDYWRLAKKKAA